MKQTTKITVEYDLKDIEEALRYQLSLEGFKLERIEPQLGFSGDDRFGGIETRVLTGIVCHVTKKPPSNYGPYDK